MGLACERVCWTITWRRSIVCSAWRAAFSRLTVGALAAADVDAAAGMAQPQGGGGLGRGVEQAGPVELADVLAAAA